MEIWKDIKSYEGLYQVSNYGRVKSLPKKLKNRFGYYISKEKLLTPCKNSGGYLWVKFTKEKIEKSFAVHRLVLCNFFNDSNLVVNHKDSNKLNNHIDNLEFLTQRQNVHHYEKTQKRASKYIGVCFDKNRNKWSAKIKVNGKTINLGRFNTELEAHNIYQEKIKIYV